ncbi:autotransporter outer membrane beta-barrel domain-containing protein [Pseudomonas guariconensis]|nr:autotransporter outer membrane beta-barrel domain-containing protein [Pseudomonas guariconensis]MBF8792396.1 autotransporter outer membrane beta-barrel domain-containing protein [Pseudomonas monteilii]
MSWYDSELRSSQLSKKLESGNRGNGIAASIEIGHRLALNDIWSVTPQAQLSWSQVRFDSFTDQYGAKESPTIMATAWSRAWVFP